MAARRHAGQTRQTTSVDASRFTVDASVFVNAFNPHETGHAASLMFLTALQQRGDPVIVPALLLVEIASAVSRATDDTEAALAYAHSIEGLSHVSLVPLTLALARQAAAIAATRRLRGADAVYVSVARRYGTVLVSRDREQMARGSAAVTCLTPETALDDPQPAVRAHDRQGRRTRVSRGAARSRR
jgi:predicted nucleic acid-binding protein